MLSSSAQSAVTMVLAMRLAQIAWRRFRSICFDMVLLY
jgi:hypothetical protein